MGGGYALAMNNPSTSDQNPSILPPDDLDARQASWPTVVGILAIIYAVLAIFANTCGTLFLFLGSYLMQLGGMVMEEGMGLPGWLTGINLAMGVIGCALAIVLMVGGFGLIRRKASSLGWLKAWSILAIISSLFAIVIGFIAIEPNIDLQIRIQDATAGMIRKNDPKNAESVIANSGLAKNREQIRSESIRNLALFGAAPILAPLVLGFFLSSRKRVEQIEASFHRDQ